MSGGGDTRGGAADGPPPSLGEWACLGCVVDEAAHGFAVARRLAGDGDIGRVWQLSRPLTYRAIERLTGRGWVTPVAVEPGDAAPERTIIGPTPEGRRRFAAWLDEPVEHPRDLRAALLLKLVFADALGADRSGLLAAQRRVLIGRLRHLERAVADDPADVVALWRLEAASAARRFVDRIA